MKQYKSKKLESLLQEKITKLLLRNFNFEGAMVTVLSVKMSDKNSKATVNLGIIPYEKELEAYTKIKNREPEMRFQLLKNTRLRYVPKMSFKIIQGREVVDEEKNEEKE